jgi:hypothetical protein
VSSSLTLGALFIPSCNLYALEKKGSRRRWIRTTGTLIPLGFEVQALNPQSSSTHKIAGCEDRTRDLWIMRPTLYQLSQPSSHAQRTSVAGVMVSIAAFQAVDPGSIPGPRNFVLGKKCSMRGSNPRLLAHKTNTLPTELMER